MTALLVSRDYDEQAAGGGDHVTNVFFAKGDDDDDDDDNDDDDDDNDDDNDDHDDHDDDNDGNIYDDNNLNKNIKTGLKDGDTVTYMFILYLE